MVFELTNSQSVHVISSKHPQHSACVRILGIIALLAAHLMLGRVAHAAPDTAASSAREFALATHIHGEVLALGNDSIGKRTLRVGGLVYVGERIRASATGEAVLKTMDAGYIAIRPNTDFISESFSAEGKSSDNFAVRLMAGSLRIISGWIGHLNKAQHTILTNTATIGIRGTDHEPYVLSAEMARVSGSKEGTYDKVNRGGTTLNSNGNALDIDAGRVGFVPKQVKQRALITLLLPILLDEVPDFYVPGRFDGELDRLSLVADTESQALLQGKLANNDFPPASECIPKKVAKDWLNRLDTAIGHGDSATIAAMFAPEITIKASVRTQSGQMMAIEVNREEFIESSTAIVKSLTNYKQRRISIHAVAAEAGATCGPIRVKTVVIEQGKLSGKPYRFETLENYLLEWHQNTWQASEADTTQR